MNRAWVPAGALAGVSVAGLLALGPLTDSLSSPVAFPISAVAPQTAAKPPAVVRVSVNLGPKGKTATSKEAALHSRGGVSETSAAGLVSAKVLPPHTAPATTSSGTTSSGTSTTTAPAKPKKKAVKRQAIISVGEANPDSGLTGAGSTKTSVGEQSSTPGSTPAP